MVWGEALIFQRLLVVISGVDGSVVVWMGWGLVIEVSGSARVDSALVFASGKFFQFWKIPPAFCIKIRG